MSIAFTDDTLAVWYVLIEEGKSDYMGALSRRDYGYMYMYTWRVREYRSLDPWDTRDKKHWKSLLIPSASHDTDDILDTIRAMVSMTIHIYQPARMLFAPPEPGVVYELVRGNKSFDEFMKEFMQAPFVHAREATQQ